MKPQPFIMIADDEAGFASLLKIRLESAGY